MKVLTFVIPAYNSEKFLDKCILSMLSDEILDKLEIIVVNDGSTDATASIAEKYSREYPGVVRLISQENKGHGGALNTGCAAAQGKYLKVIDADDWVQTGNLPEYIRLLEACESDVVLTHYHTVDISTDEIKPWKSFPQVFGRNYTFEEIMADWKSFDRCLTFHGITYRTAFYHEQGVQLSEHVFYEDHEFATFPCCRAASVMPLELFLYEYRIGDVNQSVSNANQLKRIGHTQTVIRHMSRHLKQIPAGGGRDYAIMKIQALLMSYLITELLVNPDKRSGRAAANRFMEECRELVPEAVNMLKRKYRVFAAMNRLHISKKTWDRILSLDLYNKIRGNHAFN